MTVLVKNAASFSAALERWSRDQVPEDVRKLQRVVSFELWKRATEKTPVDTGRARGNWILSSSRPDRTTVRPPVQPNGAAERSKLAALKKYDVAYLNNNLEYIGVLENGSSRQQAPDGMLGVALAEVEMIFP